MHLRKDSRPHKILKTILLVGGFLALSSVSPLSGSLLIKNLTKEYFRKKRFEKEKFLRDLRSLQKRELVDFRELPNGDIKVVITKLGKKSVLIYNLDQIKLDTGRKWDGRWRMITFDIPDSQKKARDAFRKKLRDLGLYSIQESVFITPHACEKEIDFICSVFGIRQHILIFYISRFEGEEKFRHYFRV